MLVRRIPSTRQQRALDTGHTVWLSANAGTGKTQVLTGRVLRLLLEGAAPEHILCLTFTKAAAAEMAGRIREEITGWARLDDAELADGLARFLQRSVPPEMLARARALFGEVVDRPGRLSILTIHGFCQRLLGSFPLEAGLSPGFGVMEELEAAECRREAFEALLGSAHLPPKLEEALAALACMVDDRALSELLRAIHYERTALEHLFDTIGVEAVLQKLREKLAVDMSTNDAEIYASIYSGSDDESLRRLLGAMLQSDNAAQRARAGVLQSWLEAPDAREALWEEYASFYFTEKGEVRQIGRHILKDTLTRLPEAQEIFLAEQQRLVAAKELLAARAAYRRMAALLPMAEAFLQEYEKRKKVSAKLDFDDLVTRTAALLSNPEIAPWVRFRLDGGILHVLVDEAQDTSPEQWRVIQAVCEEFFAGEGAVDQLRTLFVVGDPKQSIYRFQGADPRAYAAMQGMFAGMAAAAEKPWRSEQLDLSYRSAESVLKLVDRVMVQQDVPELLGSASVVPHEVHRTKAAGRVELWPVAKAERAEKTEDDGWKLPTESLHKDQPEKRVVLAVVKSIRRWLDEKRVLASRGRAVEPGDILILVKKRGTVMSRLVHQLKAHGIPVAGVDRLKLLDHIAVQDLIRLGRFALLPEDDLSLAIILKSPFIGLSEKQLFNLAHGRGGMSLWQCLKASEDEACKAAAEKLSDYLARADYRTPFEFYSYILHVCHGRRDAAARMGESVEDVLDVFLAEALRYQRSHPPSLTLFLDWLEAEGAEIKRNPELSGNQVRVMTVHGAKGLQAPIVFLPDAESPGGRGGGQHLWWDEASGLPFWPGGELPAFGAALKEAEKAAEKAEEARKLYVALTRAEDELYIAGWKPVGGKQHDGWWHELVTRAMGELKAISCDAPPELGVVGGTAMLLYNEGGQEKPDAVKKAAISPLPLPAALALAPAPEAVVRPVAVTSLGGKGETVQAAQGGVQNLEQAAAFGTWIHRLVELLPGVEREKRQEAAMRYLAGQAPELTEPQQSALAAEACGLLEAPELAPYFASGQAEVAVMGEVGGVKVLGRIDRIAVLENEVVLIDFKTSLSMPASAAEVPEAYKRQMEAYITLVSPSFPGKKLRSALLYTKGARLLWLS